MDAQSKQHDAANRKDHPPELIERNRAAAESSLEPLKRLDPRLCADVRRGNIVDLDVSAIVNAANETLLGGGGVDEAVHAAAGPELRLSCEKLSAVPGHPQARCLTGEARITPGFRLKAKWVIHTVAPFLNAEGGTQPELLANCYSSCLEAARKKRLPSVAFCCLGCGFYGFPVLEAALIALRTCSAYLEQHKDWDVKVIFSVFNEVEETIYRKLMRPGHSFRPMASLGRSCVARPRLGDDQAVTVMVVDQNASNNWYKAFRGATVNGRLIKVEQTSWQNIVSCVASYEKGLLFDVEPTPNAALGTSMGVARSFSPHIVLVRNFAKGAKNDEYKNDLFALQHCGVPCVNSVESLLLFTDRANAIAAGHAVQRMLPDDFQMVPINFYSNIRELYFGDDLAFPIVAKVRMFSLIISHSLSSFLLAPCLGGLLPFGLRENAV